MGWQELLRQVFGRRCWERELAKLVLGDRFPDRGDAQIDLIGWVLAGRPERGRELRVCGDVPEEYVSVEEQPHRPSNSRRISSGSGVSKSFGTVNAPTQRPNGRGPGGVAATGRNSATGWPPRITTRCSPASTRSNRASGFRWSSCRLTGLMLKV